MKRGAKGSTETWHIPPPVIERYVEGTMKERMREGGETQRESTDEMKQQSRGRETKLCKKKTELQGWVIVNNIRS